MKNPNNMNVFIFKIGEDLYATKKKTISYYDISLRTKNKNIKEIKYKKFQLAKIEHIEKLVFDGEGVLMKDQLLSIENYVEFEVS